MRLSPKSPKWQLIFALITISIVSIILFGYGAWHSHSTQFGYLTWNLLLAWLPLLLSLRLIQILNKKAWSSYEALIVSFFWLIFLPNTFYMISDYIHIQDIASSLLIYDTIMLTSFIFSGVALGFSSLVLIHLRLKSRLTSKSSSVIIAFILFICSVAIYFGRDLRWSSWNVFTNPGGLLVDISYRLQHISSFPDMITFITAFFILLIAIYNLLLKAVRNYQTINHLKYS